MVVATVDLTTGKRKAGSARQWKGRHEESGSLQPQAPARALDRRAELATGGQRRDVSELDERVALLDLRVIDRMAVQEPCEGLVNLGHEPIVGSYARDAAMNPKGVAVNQSGRESARLSVAGHTAEPDIDPGSGR